MFLLQQVLNDVWKAPPPSREEIRNYVRNRLLDFFEVRRPRLCAEPMLVALKQHDEMPVAEHEIDEVPEDVVKELNGWSTKDIVIEAGKLRKLILQRCLRVFVDSIRFASKFDENDLMEIEADLVIMALGQDTDLSCVDEDIHLDQRHNINLGTAFQTSAEGAFAAGDINSPTLVISSVAEGKRVVNSIDYNLGGRGIYFGRPIDFPESRLDLCIWDIPLAEAAKPTVEQRKNSCAEVELTFTLYQAMSEVYRCVRRYRNSVQLHLRTFPSNSQAIYLIDS